MQETKQNLNTDLSHLVREYEERGLSPLQIADSLQLYSSLAMSREEAEQERVRTFAD